MLGVGLVRGINVGGASRVAKADLAAAFEAAGFREVMTLLQSGNVVFVSDARPGAAEAGTAGISPMLRSTAQRALLGDVSRTAAGCYRRTGLC